MAIENYAPTIPSNDWPHIADFVRDAVADYAPNDPAAARDLLWACARLTHWCWRVAGYDLDRSIVFHRTTIVEFLVRGRGEMASGSAGNLRRLLLNMADKLAPDLLAVAVPPAGRGETSVPYTELECADMAAWAAGQATAHRYRNATLLLALGLGAGLSAPEIQNIRTGDIAVDDDGVLLRIDGERPRMVPVLARWEQPLADLAEASMRPDIHIFRPRARRTPRLVSHFTATCNGDVVPNTRRMRATWLIGHLTAGVPIRALMEAAGVESLNTLTRYLVHVPGLSSAQVRAALRGEQQS
ncbi:hypothetical protein GCM10027169_18420 [Gordonia jinhuaensis]|uniref:Phage integrase family protein n=1 Tax=Gordonia jinhuaensis TaxID=1517702 RepID=A0A916TIF6_9ACTN|nr:site-specific integrase [Gordonia jinhuaensis]GGB46639.1 hypothetical protein GCM10011489_37410 [Gordonia jinhuaensis]